MITRVDHEALFEQFDRICDLCANERADAIEEVRALHPALAIELTRLLSVHDRSSASTSPLTKAVWKAADTALDHDRAGEKIGRFRLLDRIGQGGMGVVYSAFDSELDRRVAVKLIRSAQPNPAERARMLREARAMARLSHPNVVTVFEAGTMGDEVFVAMEYVKGPTLRAWARDSARAWREVLAVYVEAANGLAAAHAAGLVHRDFKPDNVLVGPDRRPRVLDFGLARPPTQTDRAASSSCMPVSESGIYSADHTASIRIPRHVVTQTGAVLGTPGYMAPEQIAGRRLDHRSDQFAFCVSLYEALYGARPFHGATVAELFTRVAVGNFDPPPPDSRVPGWLRSVLLRGLQPDPEDRWPSMEQLIVQLRSDPARRWRRGAAAVVGICVLSIAVWGGTLLAGHEAVVCSDAARHLGDVWGETRRVELTDTLPTETIRAVMPVIERYADSWIDAHTEACEATRVHGEQSSEMLDRRMHCLTRKKREFAVLVDALAEADAAAVSNAEPRARALSPVAACADPEFLATQRTESPETAARLHSQQMREELALAKSCLIAYDEPNFQGDSWVFCRDTEGPNHAFWNDRISSVRVPEGAKARLCTDKSAGGHCLVLFDDAPWFARELHRSGNAGEHERGREAIGFDNQISSVEWERLDREFFSLLVTEPTMTPDLRGVLVELSDFGARGWVTGAIVYADATTFGSTDRDWSRDTGLHLWFGWEQPNELSCWTGDCAVDLFTSFNHVIGGAQPVRFDAAISETYGVLERERVYRGSLAYSWSVAGYRFVQLHHGLDLERDATRWNAADALREHVELRSSRQWLADELVRARRESQTVVLLVGEVDDSLVELAEKHPDVAVILSRTPQANTPARLPVRSSVSPSGVTRLYFEPNRISAYSVTRVDGVLEHRELWHLDLPRGYQRSYRAALAGHNARTIPGLTLAECAAACDGESEFACVSFDYGPETRICVLEKLGSMEQELRWDYDAWMHYERTVGLEGFTLDPNAAIRHHNTRKLVKRTLSQCLAACRAEREFVCRSVDYDRYRNRCDLSDKSAAQTGLTRRYWPHDHFERVVD